MSRKLRIAAIVVLALLLASLASVYSYGRFADRAQGAPSRALPAERVETAVDAASLVDRGGSGFGALLELVADIGELTGERAGNGNRQVVGLCGRSAERERRDAGKDECA